MLVDRALGVLDDGPTLPRLDPRAGEPSRHLSAW
jgi:acetyl-CoA carboxylase carboxyl transferase subunit beta